ncbi:MAG TPA: molybdopterin-dependent oxidoreductase [Methylomirabilota bacterium]|nr:molybdopterin-dependent oxidoreductase [Methylomirabilota bacterium]
MGAEKIHTYCAMCTSRCGVIATVEHGRLTAINADPDHPNGCVCVKGTAAPEIVYSPDRVRYPMVRSRPKGDGDPGWLRVTWDQAFDLIASRLTDLKTAYGAEAVVFSRATTAGSAAIDYDGWLQRLANAYGSPNFLTSNHICTWNRRVGSKYTYGVGMPLPDLDHTRCIMLWGVNPTATSPAQAARVNRAVNRGAKLIVIDPRKTTLAAKADCWLRVRPGSDGELAMAMIHVLLEEDLFDADFARRWTNAAFLVRADSHRLLTEADLRPEGRQDAWMVWDGRLQVAVGCHAENISVALFGSFPVRLASGETIECRPVLQMLKDAAAAHAPERSEKITTIPPGEVRRAARLFAREKPSCYCTWVGLEQDRDAMQTNRAACVFYALTGQFDCRGSNVLFATTPTHPITGRELLPKEKNALRLGAVAHRLGPPIDSGMVQAAQVYDAILNEKPYPIKALVLFGSDPLLGHGDPLRGKAALKALPFYVHVDPALNPSANFADVILPAASCWEREALLPFFEIAEDTLNWAQLRPAVVKPLHESRSDIEIIFELAKRLGLSENFFNGDIDAAFDWQLKPSGLTAKQLRNQPIGVRADVRTRYRKYAETDPSTARPRGFDTPSGKIEIYSTRFAEAGYPPLPAFEPERSGDGDDFPLILTFFRDIHFCDEQHRNVPRLRRAVPEPFLEIHPSTAAAQGIKDGDWIFLESASGKVRLKARLNDSLHPSVVATVYGWWQPCQELKLGGYDPFSDAGANLNLLIPNTDLDPISASVAHRAQRCRVTKENADEKSG